MYKFRKYSKKKRFDIILEGDESAVAKRCLTYWGARFWLLFIDPEDAKDLSIVEVTEVVL